MNIRYSIVNLCGIKQGIVVSYTFIFFCRARKDIPDVC
jgi:hypothetical protein